MFKRKLLSLAAIISLCTSSYFGSTFTTYEGGPNLRSNCAYTLTASGEPMTYLSLIERAATKTLGDKAHDFLAQVQTIIAQQDADRSWLMSPREHEPFYSLLMLLNGYNETRTHRFQQPDPEKPYYEVKLLETDINFAVGLLQTMTYRAKERFYKSPE